jgi:hypothetical protein
LWSENAHEINVAAERRGSDPAPNNPVICLIALSEEQTFAKLIIEQRAEPTGKR